MDQIYSDVESVDILLECGSPTHSRTESTNLSYSFVERQYLCSPVPLIFCFLNIRHPDLTHVQPHCNIRHLREYCRIIPSIYLTDTLTSNRL
jgi:hypothetical protein